MIELGYILPDGKEVDLSNYPNMGSVHLEYAKDYIKKIEKEDKETYQMWKKFSWNREFSKNSPQCDFVIQILGWIKVGVYSMPMKILNYAYLKNEKFCESKRAQVVKRYEKAGYELSVVWTVECLETMEEPPENYEP